MSWVWQPLLPDAAQLLSSTAPTVVPTSVNADVSSQPTPTLVLTNTLVAGDTNADVSSQPSHTVVLGTLTVVVGDTNADVSSQPTHSYTNGAAAPETVSGGGGRGPRGRVRRHRWRDPLYATPELQAELTEEDDATAQEVVAEAVAYVGGALMPPLGGLENLPPPPPAVARQLRASQAFDWSEVIAAIREAQRRTRDREERGRIMRYRAKVEAARREAVRRQRDEEEAEVLLVSGWL